MRLFFVFSTYMGFITIVLHHKIRYASHFPIKIFRFAIIIRIFVSYSNQLAMDLDTLKERVFRANLELVNHQLVIFTWGNVSGIDRERGLVVIKPSGVPYDRMSASQMVVLDLEGHVLQGALNPSSDTPTHLEIYKAFPEVGGIVHTHSTYATAWAQAECPIPVSGTTHADYFYGEIPCTRKMTRQEVSGEYERQTGKLIVETFRGRNPMHTPAVLVANHGPFTWGSTPEEAVHNSVVLEQVAKMAYVSRSLNPEMPMNDLLTEKHFNRKHGADAYYGQKHPIPDPEC